MLKEQCIKQDYKQISAKQNQTLFTKNAKNGVYIRIIVNDPSITEQQMVRIKLQQVDACKEIYQSFISVKDKQSLKLFRIVNGVSGLSKYLENNENWVLDIQNNKLSINCNNKEIKNFNAQKINQFDIFGFEDLKKSIMSQKTKLQPSIKYLLNKTCQVLASNGGQNKYKSLISREQMLKNRQMRVSQLKRKSQLKRQSQIQGMGNEDALMAKRTHILNIQQNQIFKYIRSDSWKIEDFDFDGLSIIKAGTSGQRGERCIFGKNTIRYKNSFTVNLRKLSKQGTRDPVIWIGIADPAQAKLQNMERMMQNIFVMSDKGRISYCVQLNKNKRFCLKNRQGVAYGLQQFKQGDVITVKVNQQKGTILWIDSKGKQLGGIQSPLLKRNDLQWVPFIQLWKVGDSVFWMDD